jgi:hypothetical protein
MKSFWSGVTSTRWRACDISRVACKQENGTVDTGTQTEHDGCGIGIAMLWNTHGASEQRTDPFFTHRSNHDTENEERIPHTAVLRNSNNDEKDKQP